MVKVATNLDLLGNQLLGFRAEVLVADPSGGGLYTGRLWFNSTDDVLRYYDGTVVVDVTQNVAGVATLTVDDATIEDTGTATDPVIRVKTGGITDLQVTGPIAFVKIGPPTADFDVASHKITSLAAPSAGTDAANKAYVDAATQGIDWKASVRVASTANGALATAYENGDTVDGVTLVTGDRILLKNQTTGSENGIYVVAASGAPARSADADSSAEVTAGLAVFVGEGTVNGNSAWLLTTNDPIVVGTTALVFAQFGSGSSYSAGTGIDITGNVISLIIPVPITSGGTGGVTAAAARANLAATTKYTTTIGNGSLTTITVTHNLGIREVDVTVYDAATFEEIIADVAHTTVNTVTLNFTVAPTTNQYVVVVVG